MRIWVIGRVGENAIRALESAGKSIIKKKSECDPRMGMKDKDNRGETETYWKQKLT